MLQQLKTVNPGYVLTMLLLLVGVLYFPALDSLFLLDDYGSLEGLAEIESRGLSFYLFGSSAGPGGRPLSLLSFALQFQSWPAGPFNFKLVNLLLHLGNGVLIFYICRLVYPSINSNVSGSSKFGVIVTMLWLLHPMQLSTVLYVVQRMTILSSSFMLVGIIIFLTGRRMYFQGLKSATLLSSMAGIYLCMFLSLLSKETGILLPLYLLVLEFTLMGGAPGASKWRKYLTPVLLMPIIILAYYLFHDIKGFLSAYQIRDYTLGQRLLTEANVLVDYLKLIFIPVSGAFSLFQDDYPIAHGLLTPPRTFFCVLLLSVLFVVALRYRIQAKLVSFATFWFLAGHILESSFISLELYFEHRNYLPSLGVIMLISWAIIRVQQNLRPVWVGSVIASTYILAVIAVFIMEVNLWKHPQLQAYEWASQHPQSKRALNHLLNIHLIMDDKVQADIALQKMQQLDRDDIFPLLKRITIANCYEQRNLTGRDWDELMTMAISVKYRGTSVIGELENLFYMNSRKNCEQLEKGNVSSLIDVLISNPQFRPIQLQLYDVATSFAIISQKADAALEYINKAISVAPSIDRKIVKLKILVAKSQSAEADKLLQEIQNQLRIKPKEMLFYRGQIQMLEQELLQDNHHVQ